MLVSVVGMVVGGFVHNIDNIPLNMELIGKEKEEKTEKNDAEKPIIARNAYDLQRLKLEKLMKNPVCMQFIYLPL
jgi:hypothetical protein